MKHAFIQHSGNTRLIVIFAGWGMDSRPFEGLSRPGYDILAVWDYRTLDFDPAWTAGYDEVCVLAWSMGVQAAQLCHEALGERVTGRIAVAGTPVPVSDTEGIPEAIFRGTLDTLDERNLARFMRRMCGGAKAYEEFACRAPQRGINELRDELRAIGRRREADTYYAPRFDHYVLTQRDAIFPPEAQEEAFAGTDIVEIDSPHLPDFRYILDTFFIDKSLVAERFGATQDTYDSNADAQDVIARYIAGLLADKDSRAILADPHATVLEVGCGTGLLTRRLLSMKPKACIRAIDIAASAPEGIAPGCYTCADAETTVMDMEAESLDMIVSASTMQWFNSPERFVRRALKALKPGGLLVMSTFGKDNLQEIAEASGVGLRLCDTFTWDVAATTMRDAEPVVITQMKLRYTFDTPLDALRHLSLTGVNAITRNSGNARGIAARMIPDNQGRYPLTYAPLFLLLRKK